ncbi:FadR family transcriptional regulator [Sedimentibacter hydroxybenzoicus DSM 7310]|uniref:FadR family transcriptional regulator n=2 Tax=Sedimentibacter hydroxybenzoicus TaxID=29345 RepID=A0A974GWW7_SEDHY|nr:FadR family transcriptional regulator [Sedimentibacter hydroxybenzoicus DSM 7310]
MDAIINAIIDGNIKINEELLPERELAAILGVGRGSLRESLAILEFLGIIETKGNRKVVVKGTDSIEKAISIIRLSKNTDSIVDFIEFRRVIETAIVKLACERATDEDIRLIKSSVDRLEEDPNDFIADSEFHINLAKASHNPIFAAVLDFVNSMMMDLRSRFYTVKDYHMKTVTEHRNILKAIENKNADQAVEQINTHLNNIEQFSKEIEL